MTDTLRAKLENKIIKIARLADEICEEVECDCWICPCYIEENNECATLKACDIAQDIQLRNIKQAEEVEKGVWIKHEPSGYKVPIDLVPTYEDLPIDLDDDNHCDECCKPTMNGCYGRGNLADDCPYDLGECCEDNLATNVGRICFEHNLPTNFAMAIIEIIQKERDRNEYLHLYRKHFPAE